MPLLSILLGLRRLPMINWEMLFRQLNIKALGSSFLLNMLEMALGRLMMW
jgi:hypothetical protein